MIVFINTETGQKFSITKAFVITDKTNIHEYYDAVLSQLQNFWDVGSITDTSDYSYISVQTWVPKRKTTSRVKQFNFNNPKRSYSTMPVKRNKWAINPLESMSLNESKKICALDVETIQFNGSVQIPIAISFAYKQRNGFYAFVNLIDRELLLIDKDKAILKLWTEFYNKLKSLNLGRNLRIYSHNLGDFDGYFILPSLFLIADNPNRVKMLIDDKSKFITLGYNYNTFDNLKMTEEEMVAKGLTEEDIFKKTLHTWNFLDSYRLFPSSLQKVCAMFQVEGKSTSYKKE